MTKSSKSIVEETEEALADSRPCPNCGMYLTHEASCLYLVNKGKAAAKEEVKEEVKEAIPPVKDKALLDIMKSGE